MVCETVDLDEFRRDPDAALDDADMRKREEFVVDFVADFGISKATAYRFVSPAGELRASVMRLREMQGVASGNPGAVQRGIIAPLPDNVSTIFQIPSDKWPIISRFLLSLECVGLYRQQ